MPKLSLNKTIEAQKLNTRTGVPAAGPPVTIPFGAIIDNVDTEGPTRKFTYQGELYRVPEDLLLSAAEGGSKMSAGHAAPAEKPAPEAAVEPRMKWEVLPSSHHQVLRSKVPGGWLVSTGAGALAFYPDPDHQWDGASLP